MRCTGERPTCKRCSRLRQTCSYSGNATPSRKQHVFISGSTNKPSTPPSKRQRSRSKANESRLIGNQLFPTSSVPRDYSRVDHDLEIPKSLVSILVEVFFDNAYNAALLLHKRQFLQSLEEGTANPHVVLSVCAWAANFYRDQNGQATLKDHGFMIQWAKKAGKLVFQQAEDLHKDNIVTFMILGLFWYSQGSWRLSQFHKGIACQMLHVIGLGSAKLRVNNSFDAETQRRRLWACYLMQCQSADNLSFFEPVADLPNLTLPWPEQDFDAGISTSPPECLRLGVSHRGTSSLYAEVIRALTLWSSVHSLIKCRETNIGERVTGVHALDEEISNWWQELSPDFKLTTAKVASLSNDTHSFPKILLLNAIYHQSLGALHASIIPLFSWSPGDNNWSAARKCSAQVAFEQACSFSALIRTVLSTYTKPSAISSFVAYAAYSGCAIQIPFMWCSNSIVQDRVQANVKANIKMIQTVALYWKFAALLQVHVGCLYEIHKMRADTLEDEPRHIDIRKLIDFKVNASYARTSILGFIDILRPRDDGYVNSGDESNDLGIQNVTLQDNSQIRQSASDDRAGGLHTVRSQQHSAGDGHLAPIPNAARTQDSSQNLNQSSNPLPQQINLNQEEYQREEEPWQQHHDQADFVLTHASQVKSQDVTERLTLDPYYPFFDQTMLDLFPNGEMPDLSQLETDLNSLDYFELADWNGGSIDAGEEC